MNVWSKKRRGKGLNPRAQAEAGRSVKEPEDGWLLGQEMQGERCQGLWSIETQTTERWSK